MSWEARSQILQRTAALQSPSAFGVSAGRSEVTWPCGKRGAGRWGGRGLLGGWLHSEGPDKEVAPGSVTYMHTDGGPGCPKAEINFRVFLSAWITPGRWLFCVIKPK